MRTEETALVDMWYINVRTAKYPCDGRQKRSFKRRWLMLAQWSPPAEVYEEIPLKHLYPEYGAHLIKDAVDQGVALKEAAAVVEKHIEDVSKRHSPRVTTWAEIAPIAAPTPSAAEPTPDQNPGPQATATAATTATPAAETESSSTLPWLIGIALIAAIILGVVMVRRKW